LPAGQQLTIPVPISNSDPVGPASGEKPVAPAGPAPEGAPGGTGQGGAPTSGGQGGAIDLKYPVQQIYAYVSVSGEPWFKIPEGVFTFLPSSGSTFDISPHLQPELRAGLPSPTPFYAQVWGWSGGQLVYLGDQSGTLGSGLPELRQFTSTNLAIIGRINDSVSYESEWTIPNPIPGVFAGYDQGFRWTAAVPGVTGGIYQVSTTPFQPGETWLVSGQVLVGKLPPPQKGIIWPDWSSPIQYLLKPVDFSVDFADILGLSVGQTGYSDWLEDILGAIQVPPKLKRWDPSLQETFYVRVIPILGDKIGEPSNSVIVHYGLPEPQTVTADSGPVYDLKVLSFTPYRAADPKYRACMILNHDLPYCHKVYSIDPAAFAQLGKADQKIVKQAEAMGQVQLSLDMWHYPSVIIESTKCDVASAKGTQSCGCPGVDCSSSSSCSSDPIDWMDCAEIAIEQLKSAAAWVAEAYSDLKGAVIDAALKYTGVGDLCKAFGTEAKCKEALTLAVDYGLAAMGVPPEIPDFDKLMSEGQDYLIETAIQKVKAQGYPCDSECEAAIKAGYGEITKAASGSGSNSGGTSFEQAFDPHPLANEQPAMMKVEVTRRLETAGIPLEHTAVCSLIVWNGATNSLYGVQLEGAPFIGVSMDIPPMEPGESMTIPVIFQRMAWNPPSGLTLKTASGQSISPPLEPGYGAWALLYYGSTVTLDLRGPVFYTPGSDGKNVSVKCLDNSKYQGQIPVP
jgi:hypothetical protein